MIAPTSIDLYLRARRQRVVVNFIQTYISHWVLLLPRAVSARHPIRAMCRDWLCDATIQLVRALDGFFESGNGDGRAPVRHRDAGETGTTMLSVAAHIRQAYVRRSKPGLSGSRQESIIGASQSAQNGRSLVALPWKNEGTERLSIAFPFDLGGSVKLSQSPIAAGMER